MTYEEAAAYILDIPKFTKKNDVTHTKELLQYLGSPEQGKKVIHVAGTNGKGSVCVYLNAMLLAQGEQTGMFVSPHLVWLNERIVLNGEQISDALFLDCFAFVLEKVTDMEKAGLPHPTFFEFLFGMAMTAFSRTSVKYVIMETGLGGRLDATNAIEKPIASVITSIGFDHMSLLGNTLERIAFEKSGIVKEGVPVFYADTQTQSNMVIESRAAEVESKCKKIGKDAYEIVAIGDKHIAFSCVSQYYGNTTWTLHNIGVYQPENAMLALEVMRWIYGDSGKQTMWRDALSKVIWGGRMEEVLPGVYVDGAHNLSAIEGFVTSVQRQDCENLILFSAVKDKDYEEMIACLCKNLNTDLYVITHIEDGRAADVEELRRTFLRYTKKPVYIRLSLKEAFEFLLKEQGGKQIYCLGSLYLSGMVKSLLQSDKYKQHSRMYKIPEKKEVV